MMHYGIQHSRAIRAAVTLLWLGTSVAASKAAENQDPPACGAQCTLVEVATARQETFTPKVSLTGAVEPKFLSDIAFRVSGKIRQRFVDVGDHVEADQVLAQIDPKDQQANLDTALAGLASAQALATQAKVAFERQESLFKSGYTTRPSYDTAQQQLRTQQAAVESAKAVLGTAQEQFGYANLKTGVAGIVTTRSAETGQVVQAGQTIFTVAQDGPRDAVFQVYETLLTDPPASRTVDIVLQSDPRIKATGTVREISPTVDGASGTVKVKVGLDSVPPGMLLGASVIGSGDFKPRLA
ncbi:efflux RND transporter periplasmic adaptor subunit, partial [Beijerinckia sp. L45]|uniref:efflux RND transporter periplasmic adaptor subunit n=1 Tax=Beijerinckia sp. L45 TaxID=1641855 RepID=UPI001FF06E0F